MVETEHSTSHTRFSFQLVAAEIVCFMNFSELLPPSLPPLLLPPHRTPAQDADRRDSRRSGGGIAGLELCDERASRGAMGAPILGQKASGVCFFGGGSGGGPQAGASVRSAFLQTKRKGDEVECQCDVYIVCVSLRWEAYVLH